MSGFLQEVSAGLRRAGYRQAAIVYGYPFAEFTAAANRTRTVPLAAFTDTPPSYRTAAFGVLEPTGASPEAILAHRDFGAPLWLCRQRDHVETWLLRDQGTVIQLGAKPITEVPRLFDEHLSAWSPDSIHRAKLVGSQNGQLDLGGFRLLADIESRAYVALDRVLRDALCELFPGKAAISRATQATMQLAFVMVASKILLDRQHATAASWKADDFSSVFAGIKRYYSLDYLQYPQDRTGQKRAQAAWDVFRFGSALQNISAEDLAFVYENTLVGEQARRDYGTYSTPRAVAEHVVARIRLHEFAPDRFSVYEPFCGAGVLLVAAAKAMRSSLPKDWNDAKRHEYLVRRLRGSDIDAFAKEVATLSLILADYPNHNGWDIRIEDLFEDQTLCKSMPPEAVVLCNPPFADFDPADRRRYPKLAGVSVHKPMAVLKQVLERRPLAVGFVMPHALLEDDYYGSLRKAVASDFDEVETVALPDRIFANSEVEASLLIARRQPSTTRPSTMVLRSSTITDAQREDFLSGVFRPQVRQASIARNGADDGGLWLTELAAVWHQLGQNPTLESEAEIHRGLEWKSGHQSKARSAFARDGFKKGYHGVARSLRQYVGPPTTYVDCRRTFLRGNAIELPWDKPKVLLNAARVSRGPWKLSAWVAEKGTVASQQFIACWPKEKSPYFPLVLSALLNSPLANAFVKDGRKRFTISRLAALPLPTKLDITLVQKRVIEYLDKLREYHSDVIGRNLADVSDALLKIDAAILQGYDLPPRVERLLLDYFSGSPRNAIGGGKEYIRADFKPCLPFEEYLSLSSPETPNWIPDVFRPLPARDAAFLSNWLP